LTGYEKDAIQYSILIPYEYAKSDIHVSEYDGWREEIFRMP
jgi:hypothetical protein